MSDQTAMPLLQKVFITPRELHQLMHSDSGVTILDARCAIEPFENGTEPGYQGTIQGTSLAHLHLAIWFLGAYETKWTDFTIDDAPSQIEGYTKLKSFDEMASLFRERGVCNDIPVVVFARWDQSFGEEGRIYWQLDLLGHSRIHILERGIFGWLDSELVGQGRRGDGDFSPSPRPDTLMEWRALEQALKTGQNTLVDTRSAEEFKGVDAQFAARRGHIPTALHYEW